MSVSPTVGTESRSSSEVEEPKPPNWRSALGGPAGLLFASALVAVAAVFAAMLMPRGPITTTEALVSMALALVVGLGAGLAMGTRWSMLAAPALFMVVFEIGRIGAVGPTVDAINLTNFYGVLAFALGRGFMSAIVLAPMVLGAAYGAALGSRLDRGVWGLGRTGWVVTSLVALALVGLAWSIARPATTAPILGGDQDGIAELTTVDIGGHDHVLMIRGRDAANPVLLYLAGGPGGTDLGALRMDTGLEQDFVVVGWEQRGAGKSYPALDPTNTLTLENMVSDTIEVTNYLRDRFGQQKIYLVGQSWGSTLGTLAAQEAPELYHAFVGVGQMVSQRETDRMFWEDTLVWAEDTGNEGLAATLRANGPPPYEDVYTYVPVVNHEHDWNSYPEFDPNNEMPAILFVPEYSLMDRVNAFRGYFDTNATLYPQLQGIDFRQDVSELEVPYYMVLGEHEARGRAVLANEWFGMLDAPTKESVVFDGAGHRPNFDRPSLFADLMREVAGETTG